MSAAPAGSAGQAANQSVAQGTTNTMGATTTGGTAPGVPTVSGYLPQFVLSFPSGTVMETLDGTNWALWASFMQALLHCNNARHHNRLFSAD